MTTKRNGHKGAELLQSNATLWQADPKMTKKTRKMSRKRRKTDVYMLTSTKHLFMYVLSCGCSPDWTWWLLRRGTGEDPPAVCLLPHPAVCHQPDKRTFYPTVYTPTRQQTAFHEAVDLHSFPFRHTNCDSASDPTRPPILSRPIPALHPLVERRKIFDWKISHISSILFNVTCFGSFEPVRCHLSQFVFKGHTSTPCCCYY